MIKSCVCLKSVTTVCVKVLLVLSDSMWLAIIKCATIMAVLVNNPSFVCSRRLIVWSVNLTLGYWHRGLVQLIEEEDYWKRRASEKWRNCDIACHGDSWKQLFFERNLNEFLEEYANSFLYLAMPCPHYRVLACIYYLRPACTNTTCHCWSFDCFDQKFGLILRLGKLFQFTHNDGLRLTFGWNFVSFQFCSDEVLGRRPPTYIEPEHTICS